MNDIQVQTAKLLARCFSKDQLAFLQIHPEFIEMTRDIESLKEALQAVELGEQLVRKPIPAPKAFRPELN